MRPVPRHHTMRGRGTRSRRNAERGPSFTLFCVLDLDFCMHSRTATRYFTVCEMSTPPHSTHEHTRLGALSDTDTPLTTVDCTGSKHRCRMYTTRLALRPLTHAQYCIEVYRMSCTVRSSQYMYKSCTRPRQTCPHCPLSLSSKFEHCRASLSKRAEPRPKSTLIPYLSMRLHRGWTIVPQRM